MSAYFYVGGWRFGGYCEGSVVGVETAVSVGCCRGVIGAIEACIWWRKRGCGGVSGGCCGGGMGALGVYVWGAGGCCEWENSNF